MRCYVHSRFGGRAAAEPCWLFPIGASFGVGWQRRCGERDCVSVWPPASASSDSCRYWRPVLTPALPSIPRSVPFPPPSASPLQTLGSFLLIPKACPPLPPSVNVHGKQTLALSVTHTRMEHDFELQTSSTSLPVCQLSQSLRSDFPFPVILNIYCPPPTAREPNTPPASMFLLQVWTIQKRMSPSPLPMWLKSSHHCQSNVLGKQKSLIVLNTEDDYLLEPTLYNFSEKSLLSSAAIIVLLPWQQHHVAMVSQVGSPSLAAGAVWPSLQCQR